MCDIFIIAGESSGDLHSSHLIKDISGINPSLDIQGIGGSKMECAGVKLFFNYSEINQIGFLNVARNYFHLKSRLNSTSDKILELSPKVLILCDFPGFNLRIAEKIRSKFKGKIFYYITPQVWAWHRSRIKKIKAYINICFVIFPFEKSMFDEESIKSFYAGNPILKQIDDFLSMNTKSPAEGKTVSIMPGSRKEEIKRILPKMLEISDILTGKYKYNVNLICSENISPDFYNEFSISSRIKIIPPDKSSNLNTIYNSDFVITKFGTSNLECALLSVPFTAVYQAGFVNYIIAKLLIKIKYVSLVNIVMNKQIVKEYIQKEFTTENILLEIQRVFNNEEYRNNMLREFKELRKSLSDSEDNAAEIICKEL